MPLLIGLLANIVYYNREVLKMIRQWRVGDYHCNIITNLNRFICKMPIANSHLTNLPYKWGNDSHAT